MSRVIGYVFLTVAYPIWVAFGICVISVLLLDDIEINSGKSTTKRWRSEKSLFRKYLFFDYREHIPKWHCALLYAFLVNSALFLPMIVLYDVFYNTDIFNVIRTIGLVVDAFMVIPLIISSFSRYSLYRGNKIRRRPQKKGKRK